MRKVLSEFYTPTEAEFKQLWVTATFSFDANVLLDIYRYTPDTSQQLRTVLKDLGDRVWVTYQAAGEYQKNRHEASSAASNALEEAPKEFEKAIAALANQLKKFTDSSVAEALNKAQAGIKEALQKARDAHAKVSPETLHDDITTLLDGKVGAPYSDDDLIKKKAEADRRTKALTPPGFMDAKKPENQFGDVILWFQLLDRAKAGTNPIILVTGDTKEDWWRRVRGKTLSPRPELRKEMKTLAGVEFYMYSPDQFLENAKKYLSAKVTKEAIQEARQVQAQPRTIAFAHLVPQADRLAFSQLSKTLAAQSNYMKAATAAMAMPDTSSLAKIINAMRPPSLGLAAISEELRRANAVNPVTQSIARAIADQTALSRAAREATALMGQETALSRAAREAAERLAVPTALSKAAQESIEVLAQQQPQASTLAAEALLHNLLAHEAAAASDASLLAALADEEFANEADHDAASSQEDGIDKQEIIDSKPDASPSG